MANIYLEMAPIIVSVITPTYNRRRFIPYLIKCYESQNYKKENMEWIILDDGQDKVKDLFDAAAKRIPNIRYIPLDEKLTIGEKRNRLNDEAIGSIIVAMDDDDYYPPERVSHVVMRFANNKEVQLAGTSEVYMYYSDVKEIYKPFAPEEISAKIAEMLTPANVDCPVQLVYQTIEGLHVACPNHKGDWYFTGNYPTPGGNRLVNKAFINYFEGKDGI